jgi:hypothetical protein
MNHIKSVAIYGAAERLELPKFKFDVFQSGKKGAEGNKSSLYNQCILMAQNRYIFLPPDSLDSPTQDTSIPNTAKSTSNLYCNNWGFYLETV